MKNIIKILFCIFAGAVVVGIVAYAVAPQDPDPAVVVPDVDMSRYRVTGGDTPTWGVGEVTMTWNDNGVVRGLELIARDGKAEFHDHSVRMKNSESITRFVDFGVPVGVVGGLLAGVMIVRRSHRKSVGESQSMAAGG